MRNTIHASAHEVEDFLRGHIDSKITKVEPIGGATYFYLEDIVYIDDELTEKVKVLWALINVYETDKGTKVRGALQIDSIYMSFADDMQRTEAIYGYEQTLHRLIAEMLEQFSKPKGKRGETKRREEKIIAEYEKQLKRKKKDFRGALHRDEVPKVKVTAKEVYDAIGDKIGVSIRYIQIVLKDYKTRIET